jgi:hypothetical protein
LRVRTASTRHEPVSSLVADSAAARTGTVTGARARSRRASLVEIDWAIGLSAALPG